MAKHVEDLNAAWALRKARPKAAKAQIGPQFMPGSGAGRRADAAWLMEMLGNLNAAGRE